MKSFGWGALVKAILVLLQSNFRIAKVLKQYQAIIRFGLTSGGFSFLFKFTRYLIQKFELKLTLDLEVLISAMVSSLALYVMDPKDMKIVNLLVYPRACEAVYSILKERGYVQPLEWGGEYLTHMITLNIITYLYSFEPY